MGSQRAPRRRDHERWAKVGLAPRVSKRPPRTLDELVISSGPAGGIDRAQRRAISEDPHGIQQLVR
jgi:hypothetical protein